MVSQHTIGVRERRRHRNAHYRLGWAQCELPLLINTVRWIAGRRPPAARPIVVGHYHPQQEPVGATASNNQLDYVFASRGFHESITVRAMNGVDEWGTSDHCRLLIEV